MWNQFPNLTSLQTVYMSSILNGSSANGNSVNESLTNESLLNEVYDSNTDNSASSKTAWCYRQLRQWSWH